MTLNFPGFDAKTPDFDLVIDSAGKFDIPILQPTRQVTGFVDFFRNIGPIGHIGAIINKLLCG